MLPSRFEESNFTIMTGCRENSDGQECIDKLNHNFPLAIYVFDTLNKSSSWKNGEPIHLLNALGHLYPLTI
jgi:hypothetical protein